MRLSRNHNAMPIKTATMNNLTNRYKNVRSRVNSACLKASRTPESVTLLAVSKRHSAEKIRQLYDLGQKCFGENQVQEALHKRQYLQDLDIQWHFIGTIQSNKTRDISEHFDWVQSVDRLKILQRLAEQRPRQLQPLNICLQVNIDSEPQKSGVLPEDLPELAARAVELKALTLRGLMAIPRQSQNLDTLRGSFSRLYQQYQSLNEQGFALDTLSMGMSADLEIAVDQGSTMVRIGTDLFGPRD